MRGPAARRSWTPVGVAALVAAGASACSLGFDAFDPVAGPDGGSADAPSPSEGGAPLDAGVDATGDDDASPVDDTGTPPDSSSSPETGPVEAGCPGQSACLSAAMSCGTPCVMTYTQCTGMCQGGGQPQQQCRNACKATEQQCRQACAQHCVTCTQQGGPACIDDNGCTSAAQM